jgi:acyl-CoA synthetase (NDP forming)
MQRIFYPQSIVVIGASDKPDNLAKNILGNLRAFDYQGSLYAVGRQASEVHGVPIVASLDEVPDGLDLAVILTPAFLVPELMETCGRKGILRVVIESGGFGEFSDEGREMEARLQEIAGRHGIRFVGPNCISVVNLETGVVLPFAPLVPDDTRLGPASVISQSGGVSMTYLLRLCNAGVGGNKAVSIGNKTDLDETDYLAYLLEDPQTEIVVLYLESVGDGRRLMELARRSAKPIIAHKANRAQASHSVAFSHTAALADDDRIVSAAFAQAGILRADGFRQTVAMAQGMTFPPVKGRNLVVISRSGGHAVVAADVAEAYGFHLHPLSEDFATAVRALFPADVIAPTNPIDLGVIFDFDLYAQIVERCLEALSPDAILLINTYGDYEAEGAHRLAHRVEAIVHQTGLPVAFCAFSRADDRESLQAELRLPVFNEIEDALRALAASRDWHAWRAHEPQLWSPVAVGRPLVSLPSEDRVLALDESLDLLRAYDIPVAEGKMAEDPPQAGRAAEALGFPVALKAVAADLAHKTDVGGVTLDLGSASAVEREAEAMLGRIGEGPPKTAAPRLLIQRMAPDGMEVIIGAKRDPAFGPVVMFGLGGVHVEVFDDVAFRVAPLTSADAQAMVGEVKGARLLDGGRGRPPIDRPALVKTILAVSQLMIDHPRISEIEANPVILGRHGAIAVDARAVLRS